ncbi:helix-turn-helix transcriptional regulator [Devosia sp. ZB163]|uniref:helix-turn-helix transcriptional regulator n=1 Tax=Devosia sp. ZB163 TaxID=3025938 RepID=UPI00235FD47C|nr:helix-turn-helix transcriptional regulator [Devosia sp. ZB163]MDC9825200.1 helix-turn-helix transcriptional regulator [Devosia sp. ZB163]
MNEPDSLPDSIYEAAAIPELWPRVLERLNLLAGADAAALLSADNDGYGRYIATEAYRDGYADYVANGREYPNVRFARSLERYPSAFSTDLELCTAAELDADPIYTSFVRKHGFDWTAGTAVPTPTGDLIVFDFARRRGADPFSREIMGLLDGYRPHLARAALVSHRLGMRAASSQAEALQHVGLPCAVVGRMGKLLAVNSPFEELAPRIVFTAHGGLAFADTDAQKLVAAAMGQLRYELNPIIRSIPVRATEAESALVVHLVPIRRAAGDVFTRAEGLIVVTPVTMPEAPLTHILTGLFDLTPAEAKVARGIASGLNVEGLAELLNLSPATIRNQLNAVLNKTGTRRQAELTLLLSGTRPMPEIS